MTIMNKDKVFSPKSLVLSLKSVRPELVEGLNTAVKVLTLILTKDLRLTTSDQRLLKTTVRPEPVEG